MVHDACLQQINAKIEALELALEDLFSDAEGESKSSAGDKHETGRAMLQIEQARIGKQLSDLRTQRNLLRSINPEVLCTQVAMGSLVETGKGWFYISVALGKITVQNQAVMSLSPNSPLGAAWLGMGAGETVTFNETVYSILHVY